MNVAQKALLTMSDPRICHFYHLRNKTLIKHFEAAARYCDRRQGRRRQATRRQATLLTVIDRWTLLRKRKSEFNAFFEMNEWGFFLEFHPRPQNFWSLIPLLRTFNPWKRLYRRNNTIHGHARPSPVCVIPKCKSLSSGTFACLC